MLNRTPPSHTKNTLNAYRKRRQFFKGPFLIYSIAALLLIGGIALVISATRSGNNPIGALFPTDTLTPTLTPVPTNTVEPSVTPTFTLSPTITITPTPTGPIAYTIKEGDTLQGIAEQFNLGPDGVLLLLDFNAEIMQSGGVYFVGQTIQVPPAGTVRNTATPLPSSLGRGARIDYQVLPGDTLAGIAAKFNSLEEEIITLNNLENPNDLQAGQALKIPVNLVTATATLPATSTPVTPTIAGQPTQAAVTGTVSAPAACAPTENATFVTELQTLINKARTDSGLSALTVNENLTATAKAHAIDMVCNNYFSHLGLSGSTPETRVQAQGYSASLVLENLYALHPAYGINAQTAFNWWMNNDSASRANILNPNVTEFGISYQVSEKSLFGGYFVVLFAKP
ncbi:MAG TPA: LysM peptidoglycan-binding domain-containing protein [Anaerolineales bacterium]|nr:LysM peptidoglycan-binding domain-containing protein [Anaerolineales bacterium]